MVVQCLETIGNNTKVRDCRAIHGKSATPVTSRQTELTYVNTFCLLCNEGEAIGSSVVDMWDVKLVHYAREHYYRFVFHPLSIIRHIQTVTIGYSNFHYVPRTVHHL